MAEFSVKSKKKLESCHQDLQDLMNEVIKHFDITILCGYRGKDEQNAAYYSKPQRSKLKYPRSKHNKKPSLAVDVAPWPLNWQDIKSFQQLAIMIKDIANQMGIKIRWGGDFKGFADMPHWELME